MTPNIQFSDFSGGLNVRELGHRIAPNEATDLRNVEIQFGALGTLPGDSRELIDFVKYPPHPDYPGSAGGAANAAPILGRWRYYHDTGIEGNNAWVRVHGTVCEYWAEGSGQWVTMGAADWPNGVVPNAIQFGNRIFITHGVLNAPHLGKVLYFDGTVWQTFDIAIPTNALYANVRPTAAVEYQDRIFFLDSQDPFELKFTGTGLAFGISPIDGGGFVNKGRQKGDPMVGLRVHRGKLYVFRRASVWIYFVDYAGNDYMEQVQGAAGCIAHRSICAYHDALYYASTEGMNSIYGADNDCVSHKINDDVEIDPDFVDFTQAIVDSKSGTLWVTFLTQLQEISTGGGTTETGGSGPTAFVFNTTTYRADIRRPNILTPRWVKLTNYRITNLASPPGKNTYMGDDFGQVHFDAQQPDVTEWNPTADSGDDPAYIPPADGGPRHYSYRFNVAFDRDQIPSRGYSLTRPADSGIGYFLVYAGPRTRLPIYPIRGWFKDVRLDYFVFKNPPIHKGFDAGYGRVQIEERFLEPEGAVPNNPTWFPIDAATPVSPAFGGHASEEWGLRGIGGTSKGTDIKFEFYVIGTKNRANFSHSIEFRFFVVNWDQLEGKYVPQED